MYTSNSASTSASAEPMSYNYHRQMLPADKEPDKQFSMVVVGLREAKKAAEYAGT